MYPIEKYRFFTQETPKGIKTIAVTTYAGKTVRGTAICAPSDIYDEEMGKKIAAARCAVKVAEKRRDRACRKFEEAEKAAYEAEEYMHKMDDYWADAHDAYIDACDYLSSLID